MSNQPVSTIPVIDVDQAFPLLTADGARVGGSPSAGAQTSTAPAVQDAIRDVLGWRPRARDTNAFTAALTASFQLTHVEGHVVSTYQPRGYAMQADLGGVTGGQASLYTRAVAGRTQMLTLLDGLQPLRADADDEDCEAFRSLVRNGLSRVVDELGAPGGPRVAVVDAYLGQLLGTSAQGRRRLGRLTADTVDGQLGALRDQFGLEDARVNDIREEGLRTSYWTMVDLVIDTARAWASWRRQFTNKRQFGFLGTQLVLVNQLLSAIAEQVDEVEAALDSVLVSAAERQTIEVPGSGGMTVAGLLSWIRTFVTEEGPRIVRDTGRDGIATSFTPTLVDLTNQISALMGLVGARITVALPATVTRQLQLTSPPSYTVQVPLIAVSGRRADPPGLQASRTKIAVSGLQSLVLDLANKAMRISRYPGVVLLDVVFGPTGDPNETLVAIRGLNLRDGLVPTFGTKAVRRVGTTDVQAFVNRISADDDTITAVFETADLKTWGTQYDKTGPPVKMSAILKAPSPQVYLARDLPGLRMTDNLTGRRLGKPQTRPS